MLRARADFSKTLQDWDGFGVNYVEAAQTRDCHTASTVQYEPVGASPVQGGAITYETPPLSVTTFVANSLSRCPAIMIGLSVQWSVR